LDYIGGLKMASIITEVCKIDKVMAHPDPETLKLELVLIKGWTCVVPKGQFKENQLAVYFQPDTILPKEVTDRLGVTNYTSTKPQGQRIRSAIIRGCVSLGLVIPIENPEWKLGDDVSSFYKSEKYFAPIMVTNTEMAPEHSLFLRFTDIENLRNFPDVLVNGETVIVTEKLEGTNSRTGIIDGELDAIL
jgi:RNA ligase (TIGR02306 family)